MRYNMKENFVLHGPQVTQGERVQLIGQRGICVWFTGLSGSGKSTISFNLEKLMLERGVISYVLDGDNLRYGINCDLGFTETDRRENVRRVGHISKLFVDAGIVTFTAAISPYRADRQAVRRLFQSGEFLEVFVDCPLEVCVARDVKGLYHKALSGEITNFTGVTAPYEPPEDPDLILKTGVWTLETSTEKVLQLLEERGLKLLPRSISHE